MTQPGPYVKPRGFMCPRGRAASFGLRGMGARAQGGMRGHGGILEVAPFRGSWDELRRIPLEKLV